MTVKPNWKSRFLEAFRNSGNVRASGRAGHRSGRRLGRLPWSAAVPGRPPWVAELRNCGGSIPGPECG